MLAGVHRVISDLGLGISSLSYKSQADSVSRLHKSSPSRGPAHQETHQSLPSAMTDNLISQSQLMRFKRVHVVE